MEQFTFYDIYADVIDQLSDDEAGRFVKRLCGYSVLEQEDKPSKNETENCFWEIILPTLSDATAIERQGKIPYYLNRQMRHFTFKAAYARMLHTIKDDADAGKFIKAICKYMFEGKEPQELASPINNYFKLFRKSFDLSKHRSESGKKGGKAKKKPKKTYTFEDFMRYNPHIQNDLFSEKLKEDRDWELLNARLKENEKWRTETRLYKILSNYRTIIGG